MSMQFKKARKSQAKLRLGLIGPSGSGKTYTALSLASGLGKKIAVVDTEHASAALYADEFGVEYDTLQLTSFEVENYVEAIELAAREGYEVLIIDSLSHAWAGKGGILEFVDKAAKRTGNNFAGWRDATPKHNLLVEAILAAPIHIICTLRSKVEHIVETVKGRSQVRKVGMQPVQRDGLEYEFTIVGDLTQEHDLIVTKTRAAFLADAVINKPGRKLGEQLHEWLDAGEAAPPPELVDHLNIEPTLFERIKAAIEVNTNGTLSSYPERIKQPMSEGKLTAAQCDELLADVERKQSR